jgi:ragB/susD domain protein
MILIAAEGLYHTGSEADAHTLLYALQKNRDASATKSTNTGTALLDEILLERRKELYGEIGVEWYDAKRLQKGITRDSWHNVNLSTNPILANDKRFYLLVPQGEIDANDKISRNINDNR